MYFQRFSPAPPSALPTSAVGNLPVQSLPVPPHLESPEPVAAAEAVGPDFGAPRRAGRRRRRRGVPPDANAGDWVFCLSMTLLFLLTILGALAYFSVKKLLALKRRGPHH
ncbi:hypothetical protein MTO96_033022 [Rhipicephalus appendiculatus]